MRLRPLTRPRGLSPRLYDRTIAARAEADRLAAHGHHVHYVAHGYTACLTHNCTPKATQ